MKIISGLIESLFPSYCVGCRKRGGHICHGCTKVLPPAQSPENSWITSVFAYQDPRIRKLIRILKFKNGRKVADFFGTYLRDAITEFIGEEKSFVSPDSILLIPIPLSKNRLRQRGYNQTELLANSMMQKVEWNFVKVRTDILKKEKETIAQTDMKKREERMKNISDCFAVSYKPEDLSKTVILLDDVTTTGATLIAARKTLKAAGFRKVFALTVAH